MDAVSVGVDSAGPGLQRVTLDQLRAAVPDYARDLRLNLGSILSPQGSAGLSEPQIWAVALACAIAARNACFARQFEALASEHLDGAYRTAAKTAAALMGMNNIYYRFVHLVENPDYQSMPARLRMNALASPGIAQLDLELLSLAVSAVNGCGLCMRAHERKLREQGVSREAIQSAVRIAAVVHGIAGTLEYAAADADCRAPAPYAVTVAG